MKFKWWNSKLFLKYPLVGALCAQLLSLFVIKIFIQVIQTNLQLSYLVFLQACLSVFITQQIFKLPKWFFFISILFPLTFVLAFHFFQFSSWVYGVLFIFFALTFSHTLKERVPLYLTNEKTYQALRKITKEINAKSIVDLGSGLGGVVRALSEKNIFSYGVETAPLLWIISSLLSFFSFKGKILRQNIWNTKLSEYDMVYAFLSPAIMEKLYQKVKSEMRSGSLFVSNSFAVEGVLADEVWQLDDQRQTILYLYKIK
ncbi:MAG: hypothetical protein Q7U04_00120 [Bacteriovorax sp.]|nr:hypothetical protein [Bacteriovorax sp.]